MLLENKLSDIIDQLLDEFSTASQIDDDKDNDLYYSGYKDGLKFAITKIRSSR
jgi:hypothetical protein